MPHEQDREMTMMKNPLQSCPPLAERSEQYVAAGWWRTESFVDDLRRAADEVPDKVALIGWRHCEARFTRVTFGDLAIQVDQLAAGLAGMGITPGTAVAFQLPNWWETSALTLACARIGAIAVPVPMWFGARDLELMLAATGAAACVVTERWEDIDYRSMLAEMAPRLPALRHPLVVSDSPASVTRAIERHSGCGPSALPESVDPNAPAVVFFTSGTCGVSKGVIHSQNTLHAAARGFRGLGGQGIGATDVLACLAPPSTALGALCSTVWPLVEHGVSVFSDIGEPQHRLRLMSDQGVTCLVGTPGMIAELAAPLPDRQQPASLRLVVSTAAPLTRSIADTATRELGARLVNLWGMTETQGGTSTVEAVTPESARCMGRTLPGVEIRTHGTETAGIEHLSVRGPSVCLAVFNRDTGAVLWEPSLDEGWFNTGDLVASADHGGLTFMGRTSDRVMGDDLPLMIPALEIEEEIRLHPDIVDAAFVSYTDGGGVEHPCAVIVVAPSALPPNLTELRSFLIGRGISRVYLPSRLAIGATLPRDLAGKIRKRVLVDQLSAGSPGVST
jgi:cyclohexanecarboxylate-CoA ligase